MSTDTGRATTPAESEGTESPASMSGAVSGGHQRLLGRFRLAPNGSSFAASQQDALDRLIDVANGTAATMTLPVMDHSVTYSEPPVLLQDRSGIATPARPKSSNSPTCQPVDGPSGSAPRSLRRQRPAGLGRAHALHSGRTLSWPLMGILALQIVLSLRLIWSNTAFMDEALYLWAGHLEITQWLHGVPLAKSIDPFPTYFSGAPVLYPPLGAIADTLGGLAGARLLSLGFMLGATSLLYFSASRLFGRTAAVAGSAVFAVLGPTQFLSAFATYDPMALFLIALTSWLVIRGHGRASELFLIMSGLTLALADATKYAALLWDPVVVALVMLTAERGGWLRATLRGSRFGVYVAVPLAITLFHFAGESYIRGILFTTLARQVNGNTATPSLVLIESLAWLGLVPALAVIAIGVGFRESRRIGLICFTLAIALLLAPLHQAQIHTTVSLQKHVDFGAWFGSIAAGYVLASASDLCRSKGWRVIAAAVVVVLFSGVIQANALFPEGWPNMTKATTILGRLIPAASCPCLVTSDNVVAYYLINKVPAGEAGGFVGAWYFNYWDPAQRRLLSGPPAYTQAIYNHYFSILEVDPSENPQLYETLVRALRITPGYKDIDTIPIPHWGHKVIEIWRYESGRRRGGRDHHGNHT